jgi:hypothetical protein
MRSLSLRTCALVVPLLLFAAPGAGAPNSSGKVPLHLRAGEPEFQGADDSSYVPRIKGFGHASRPGEAMIPLKVLLVAIPEGADPELRILDAPAETLRSRRIAQVPRLRARDRRADPRPDDFENDVAPDPGIPESDGARRESPVSLGRIGYLREQRFVEVLYTPIVHDARRGSTRFFPKVEAEIIFGSPGAFDDGAATPTFSLDPLFEETYRRSLVNYEQGKQFRVRRGERSVEAPGEPGGLLSAPLAPGMSSELEPAAAGGPRYKVLVSRAGIYRLNHAYLQARAPDLLARDPRTLVLLVDGVEVPISIRDALTGASGEADGVFGPSDVLEFYGEPKTEPATLLNYDFGAPFPDVYQANDFTDTQVYWLSSADPPGSHARIPSVGGAPVGGLPLASTFEAAAVWNENNIYLPLEGADPFFSIPSLFAGSSQEQRDLSLPLPGLAPGTAPARVLVRLRGGSDLTANPDHRTRAWVNANTSGAADFTWDGEVIQEHEFTVAQSVLSNPATIHLSAPGLSGVTSDRQYPDQVTIRYQRQFSAVGDALSFSYPNQDVRFSVSGFSGATPTIFEITRRIAGNGESDPVGITGAAVSGAPTTTYTFEVTRDASPGAPAVRSFVVAGPAGILSPDALALAGDPVLADPANAADILVIAARDAVDATPGGSLDALLAHRQASQGLTSRVVYVDQIYDEFSYGRRDMNAIRSFLAYAFENWTGASGTAPPPSFVLLVGDASADYKNTLNIPDWIDQVPTAMMFNRSSILGYYSSDNWIASFRGGDQVPDVHLGRISTRTAAASAAVFDKIRAYEQSPPPGLWKGRMVLVTSEGKTATEQDDFERVQDSLTIRYFSNAPYSVPDPSLYFGSPPWNATDAAGMRAAIRSEIQAGAAVLSFVGHGSFETWGLTTFWNADDASALTNGTRMPFMVNINCLAGGFHFLAASGALGERMTNNPAGGAIATLAPSGLSNIFVGETVTNDLFGPLFGPRRERGLGIAVTELRTSFWSEGRIIDLQNYTFLGDPATLMATPAPAPPSGLSAAAGNSEVTLSWTASAEPVAGYSIYRSTASPAGIYARIACDPLTATSCVDRAALNATTYYYYAVSRDAEGFEGKASNFNSDCGAGGPDCVSARPINPGPPSAPSRPVLADPGLGGWLEVSWPANPESDLKNYIVHYGTQSLQYSGVLTVGPASTSATLIGLTNGVRYYVALSATNTSGHESLLSPESFETPHLIQGIAPPRAIMDLSVTLSGADVVLTWSRPLLDIYGRPTVVAGYRVYRGTDPGFVPSATTLAATIGDGSVTTFRDVGQGASSSTFFYLVTALDGNGFASGAGRDLPFGIEDLAVAHVDLATVRLAWTPVTTDVRGLPTLIDHYQVHRMNTPLRRQSLDASTLFLDNVTGSSVDLPVLSGPTYISVIAVDNRGNLSPF